MKPCRCKDGACKIDLEVFALLSKYQPKELEDAYMMAAERITQNPDCWRGHRAYAHALMHQHRARYAIPHLELAVCASQTGSDKDGNAHVALELAQAHLQAGNPDRAKQFFETIAEGDPKNARARHGLMEAQTKLESSGTSPHHGHAKLNLGHEHEARGEYEEAWACFKDAKADLIKRGYVYNKEDTERRFGNLRGWLAGDLFERLQAVKPLTSKPMPCPLFIMGYPRSGTTLLEQILTMHDYVSAGGELPFIAELTATAQRFLASKKHYPECLNELLLADTRVVLSDMRSHFMHRIAELDTHNYYITDKMPLNECHLPFVHLLFPEAPKILIRRNPLDCIMSNYSLFLTHGSHQACDPASAWHHWKSVTDLVDFYQRKSKTNLLIVKYENLIAAPEWEIAKICDYLEIKFDSAMLKPETNTRYAHTASFAQVRVPINAKGVGRWKHYEKQLREALPQEAFDYAENL